MKFKQITNLNLNKMNKCYNESNILKKKFQKKMTHAIKNFIRTEITTNLKCSNDSLSDKSTNYEEEVESFNNELFEKIFDTYINNDCLISKKSKVPIFYVVKNDRNISNKNIPKNYIRDRLRNPIYYLFKKIIFPQIIKNKFAPENLKIFINELLKLINDGQWNFYFTHNYNKKNLLEEFFNKNYLEYIVDKTKIFDKEEKYKDLIHEFENKRNEIKEYFKLTESTGNYFEFDIKKKSQSIKIINPEFHKFTLNCFNEFLKKRNLKKLYSRHNEENERWYKNMMLSFPDLSSNLEDTQSNNNLSLNSESNWNYCKNNNILR